MLWFKKQPNQIAAESEPDLIIPAELSVPLDARQFQQKFSALQKNAEEDAGVDAFLASLQAKHELFSNLLAEEKLTELSMESVEALLETVFSARRRVYPSIETLGIDSARERVRNLLYGKASLLDRLDQFSDVVVCDDSADKETRKLAAKNKRAAFDFGAELLHFNNPIKYPLMTRWVWDQNTVSGALREFIRGNDTMPDVPLGNSPEMYEGARTWLATQLAEQGLYKDVHFWVDLVQAQAYAEYFRSMAEGMLSADFGRASGPSDHIKKFLGIDAPAKVGLSRVRRETLTD
ncbi:hypothetical protein [Sulfuriferula nivalis]|uniref:Uncharacterized protein n=1 Tax=Sulfuriferula nivalis TaxID=2675298 RepID=A0A809SIJ9_9PROT|nr:hypothetical protein [Sulfuriferula nivalis]BBP02020.1 hypothetical protein SFSGTM_27280 [Sulfuriferula nivalis]